jgi:hypothetical protein
MAVRLSASRARRPNFTPRKIPVTSVKGLVDVRAIARLEELGHLEKAMTSPRIEQLHLY